MAVINSAIDPMEELTLAIHSVQKARDQLESALLALAAAQAAFSAMQHLPAAPLTKRLFGRELARLRAVAGLSQRDLAAASGISIAQIGRYEDASPE